MAARGFYICRQEEELGVKLATVARNVIYTPTKNAVPGCLEGGGSPVEVVTDTSFMGFPLFARGKVRDIYSVGGNLLIVSTDRISAFDVIMEQGIPGKGAVLNRLAESWFKQTEDIIQNHMITTDVAELPYEFQPFREQLTDRSMLVV